MFSMGSNNGPTHPPFSFTTEESSKTSFFGNLGDPPVPPFGFQFSTSTKKSAQTNECNSTGNANKQTPMNEEVEESICLKVAIQKKKNRVVFLECSNDFVDIIFSFLCLPIGRVLSILQGKSPATIIGCMSNLYESVGQLDSKHFSTNACKEMLLQPRTSLGRVWRKLKLKVDEALNANECQSKTSSEQSGRGLHDEDC